MKLVCISDGGFKDLLTKFKIYNIDTVKSAKNENLYVIYGDNNQTILIGEIKYHPFFITLKEYRQQQINKILDNHNHESSM